MLLQYLQLSTRNALLRIWAVCHNRKSGKKIDTGSDCFALLGRLFCLTPALLFAHCLTQMSSPKLSCASTVPPTILIAELLFHFQRLFWQPSWVVILCPKVKRWQDKKLGSWGALDLFISSASLKLQLKYLQMYSWNISKMKECTLS